MSEHHTCISLQISRQNKCKNCTRWEERCISCPGKKRDSKCERPWELPKGGELDSAHYRTLQRVCSSWSDMIHAGIFKSSNIPPNVRIAASKVCHKFPSSSSAAVEQPRNFVEIIEHPRRVRRTRSRLNRKKLMSPISKPSPKERRKKLKKVGGATTTVYDEQRKMNREEDQPSPLKKTTKMITNLVNSLESKFSATLNLVGNNCGNLNCVADVDIEYDEQPARQNKSAHPHQENHNNEIKLFREKNEALELEMKALRSEMCNLQDQNKVLNDRISNLEDQIGVLNKKRDFILPDLCS